MVCNCDAFFKETNRKWLRHQSWLTVSFWSKTRFHMICETTCEMQVCMRYARLHFRCKTTLDVQDYIWYTRLHMICKITCDMQVCMWYASLHVKCKFHVMCKFVIDIQVCNWHTSLHVICKFACKYVNATWNVYANLLQFCNLTYLVN